MSKNKKQIYYSIRTVEAHTHKQALNKVLKEDFAESEAICDKILTINQLIKQLKFKQKEGRLYARKCSITGKGMNEGWCFHDGEDYAKSKKSALILAKKYGYKSLKAAYNDNSCYWTQWEMPEDAQYIIKNGKLTETAE